MPSQSLQPQRSRSLSGAVEQTSSQQQTLRFASLMECLQNMKSDKRGDAALALGMITPAANIS